MDPVDPKEPTAVLLVTGFNSFGLHSLLSVVRYFPNWYKNFIYVSVAEIDSGTFKGAAEIKALEAATREGLEKYVKVTRRHGFPADYRMERAPTWGDRGGACANRSSREFPECPWYSQGSSYFIMRLSSTEYFTTRRPLPSSGGFSGPASPR